MAEWSQPTRYTSEAFKSNKKNLISNRHKGRVSVKAMKEIKNSVNWLIHAAQPKQFFHKESNRTITFRVNFITLTLPDTYVEISDADFKKNLLAPLLATLRKGYGLKNYVWKLELQANGKLHAHLTTDTFIWWKDLRYLWNKRLIVNGYMQKYKDANGHCDPNSTDVHAVREVKDLAAYISKYMAKDSDKLDKVKGRIWGCNYQISRCRKPHVFVDRHSTDLSMPSLLQKKIRWSPLMLTDKKTLLQKSIGDIYFLEQTDWAFNIHGAMRDKYDKIIATLQRSRTLFESDSVVVSGG